MRRHLSFFLLSFCLFIGLVCVSIQPVRAHIVGAFQDFLLAMEDDKQTEKLQEALVTTKGKYEEAKKQKEEQEAIVTEKQEAMLEHLVFYDTIAFDTYASFLLDGTDLVDVMANSVLMNKQLKRDQEELEAFYNDYKQWEQTQESLLGYQELLEEIEANQAKKRDMQKTFPNVSPADTEVYAGLLQAIWNQDMAEIDEHLIEDADVLTASLPTLFHTRTANDMYTVKASDWNKSTTLRYLIQNDHIYVVYEEGRAHTILVTSFLPHPTISHAYYLDIEAGFLNGYPISTPLLQALNGLFVITYDPFIEKGKENWVWTARTSQLHFQPTSATGE